MHEFGWEIDYVLSLSFPVFLYLTSIIKRVRADYAIDTFFTAYVAAKSGRASVDILYRTAGSFFLDVSPAVSREPITPETIKTAEDRMQKIIAAQERKLAEASQ